MKVELKKGTGSIDLVMDDDKVLDVITGNDVPALDHEKVKQIISQGIRDHLPQNYQNKKVAVIIPDDTRLWARGDLFVPVIVKTLTDAGLPRGNIKIIIALGTHKDAIKDQFRTLAGDYCVNKGIEILNSANQNKNRLVFAGKTFRGTQFSVTKEAWEADHIIIFGGILHHLIAGFGGGRKYILPGIAGYDSIQQNHSLAVRDCGTAHPMVGQTILEGNPIHEDMDEAAALFLKDKTSCYAAVAANGAGRIFHARVGELNETFIQGCDVLNTACCVTVKQKADFALISAGGHRTDGELYQATKALFNAVNVVKENGDILFVADAFQGIGNKTFGDVLVKYRNRPGEIGKALLSDFNMPSYVAFRVMDILARFNVTLISSFNRENTLRLGFGYTRDVRQYLEILKGKGFIIPFAENILPLVKN